MGVLTDLEPDDVHTRFIETGYGWGESLRAMSELPFRELHSIELDPAIVTKARATWWEDSRVWIHQGDSPQILRSLIDWNISTTFFLDAHYAGGVWYGESRPEVECPVLDEIRVILAFDWSAPYSIVIDDIRLFTDQWWEAGCPGTPGLTREKWPTLAEVLSPLRVGHEIRGVNDMAIARPRRAMLEASISG